MSSRYPDREASRAVLIGVGTYDHPERLHDVPAVTNNLADLHQLLSAPGGVLSAQNCWTVEDPGGSAQIGHILEDAAEEATDSLVVYYTGHGVLDSRGRLHLALTGTDPDRTRWTALPFSTLREAILDSPAATRILILDCCFSGRAFEALSDGPDAVLGEADIAGTYTITSSARNEASFAPIGKSHTAFTAALLAAASTPGLTLDDLYTHTRRHLQRHGHPKPQRRATNAAGQIVLFPDSSPSPPISTDDHGRAPIVQRKSLGPEFKPENGRSSARQQFAADGVPLAIGDVDLGVRVLFGPLGFSWSAEDIQATPLTKPWTAPAELRGHLTPYVERWGLYDGSCAKLNRLDVLPYSNDGVTERHRIRLEMSPTGYFDMLATNALLSPFTPDEAPLLAGRSGLEKTRMSNLVQTELVLITLDGMVPVFRRASQMTLLHDCWQVTSGETFQLPIDLSGTSGRPDLFKTALRGLDEEAGLKSYLVSDLAITAFVVTPEFATVGVLMRARFNCTALEFVQRHSRSLLQARDSWEHTGRDLIPIDDPSALADALTDRTWSKQSATALIYAHTERADGHVEPLIHEITARGGLKLDAGQAPNIIPPGLREELVRKYLLSDPEAIVTTAPPTKDRPPGTAVLEALSRDSARLFVDVMRLLSARSSAEARSANDDGIPYFKELAARHRSDLREDLTRAGRGLPAVEPFGRLEAALTWSMWTLDDPRSHAALSDDAVHQQLAEAAEILAEILDRSGKYRAERRAAETAVAAALESLDTVSLPHGPRGRAQTELLDRRDGTDRRLRSVQEDVDNELGIPYFWIDYLLLQRWRATDRRAENS
ncbi:caspase family protein [Nocardia rhamnosiphila]|uniref:Caspase family protein n=1 Tax=Nocardia rhamnosiphila TaxID=426716 RepID=A0ABV2WXP2_9NOCA